MLHDRVANIGLDGVHQLLEQTVQRLPQGRAIDFFGRCWTWAQVAAEVERVAAGLQGIGVKKGDRVGLCLPNMPQTVVAYFAILKIGAIVVNYNPLYVEREIEHQIRDSGTTVMFVVDVAAIHRKVAAVAERAGLRTIVLCCFADALPRTKSVLFRIFKRKERLRQIPSNPQHVDYAALATTRRAFSTVETTAADVAVLQYTGGTTGTPKGAALTHGNLIANTAQVAAHDPTRLFGCERVLGVLPPFSCFCDDRGDELFGRDGSGNGSAAAIRCR